MFYLDFVVDDLFGSTTSGAARDFDIVPRERRLIGVLVCECVVGRRPRIVVVRGKRNDKDSRRVVREGSRDEDGNRGNHGCLSFSIAAGRLQFFLEGKGVCTFLVGHGKGRVFLFKVDHMVVVPSIRTFHHDVVMHEVGALVNDDVNGTTAKKDA